MPPRTVSPAPPDVALVFGLRGRLHIARPDAFWRALAALLESGSPLGPSRGAQRGLRLRRLAPGDDAFLLGRWFVGAAPARVDGAREALERFRWARLAPYARREGFEGARWHLLRRARGSLVLLASWPPGAADEAAAVEATSLGASDYPRPSATHA